MLRTHLNVQFSEVLWPVGGAGANSIPLDLTKSTLAHDRCMIEEQGPEN
jgi:hypothetical protein